MRKILVMLLFTVSMFASALSIEQVMEMPVYAYHNVPDSKLIDTLDDFIYFEDYVFEDVMIMEFIHVKTQYRIEGDCLTVFYTAYYDTPLRFMFTFYQTLDGYYLESAMYSDEDGEMYETMNLDFILALREAII